VLTGSARVQIKAVARSLAYVRGVTCEGYSDYSGSPAYENALSRRRAMAVCGALVQYGARVSTALRGYGRARPVVVGGDDADRLANRRVVVVVIR
jgi:outer membrane protein OmpA-like peptidoglycan-associated protein